MTNQNTKATRDVPDYYKHVERYHQLAEQSHENLIVGCDLLLKYLDTKGVIVDVAGGSGFNAELLSIDSSRYFCTDLSLNGLAIVKERKRGSPVQTDVSRLPIRGGVADVVLCSWSLEHFTEPEGILEEMVRVVRPGGRIVIWGPNWDNIFRKDFPQFAHKSRFFREKVRWKIFFKMLKNEFLPFRYAPFTTTDVAAFVSPERYISLDTDATHCVLCQETYKFFQHRGCSVIHISDFSEMLRHVRNDAVIRIARKVLEPFLPVLRNVPLVRWFVIRFPIIVQKGY